MSDNNFADLIVSKITIGILVKKGEGARFHKNRYSNGLALNGESEKLFIFSDGTRLTVKPKQLIFLPKNSTYEVQFDKEGDIYCINFQFLKEKTRAPFVAKVSNYDELLKCFKTAEHAWKQAGEDREYRVMSELYKIIYEVERNKKAPYVPKNRQEKILPAMDYIHKNYTEEIIDLKKLANLCNISYDYLRKLFIKFYGVSPIKYINNLKLSRAKELLLSGMCSIKDCAYQSGFSDASHFCRFFKENEGELPSEFIKRTK